jgi:1,2-diacylglycerol 3-alpha-glucosyltransferase
MRIALFCDSYKPYISGVTNSVSLLVKELRALKHRVYIFAPRYPEYIDTDPDIIRFPSLPTAYPNFRLALPYINRIPDIDLVHAHSPFQAGLLARYVARKRRTPLVYTFHTLFTRYVHYARIFPEPLSKMALVRYLQDFCEHSDLVIAPSKMARRTLKSWKVKKPIEVVPSGVDFSEIDKIDLKSKREEVRRRLGLPRNAKVLLYVGRISKEKNINFLLAAHQKIAGRLGDPLYLVMVGAGPLEEEIQKKKHERLILAGEIKYPEVLSYYLAGDIFVFASTSETQGLVLAEAKALGLPVVAVFAGGLADTVRSGIDGYLTSRAPGEFIRRVKELLANDDQRAKMSRLAQEDARERFSSLSVAKRTEILYNSLCQCAEQ